MTLESSFDIFFFPIPKFAIKGDCNNEIPGKIQKIAVACVSNYIVS